MWRLLAVLSCLLLVSCSKQVPEQKARKKNEQVSAQKQRQAKMFMIPHGDFILGDKKAFIPIVMFVDFYCAKCARAHRIIQDMLKDPELKNIISVSFRHYPQRQQSVKAAKAVMAAGLQGSAYFWKMADRLFAADGEINDQFYVSAAQQIGLDAGHFSRTMVSDEEKFMNMLQYDGAIIKKIKSAGSAAGIFVGGHLYRGPLQREPFKKFIYSVKNYNERAITTKPMQ